MSQIVIENTNNWRLIGELSFATAGKLLTDLTSKIATLEAKELTIDLKEITDTDSAGLALLIELLKLDISITFCNIPTRILNLSSVAGVEELLTQKGI
ncbi:STAS domain-containing protein [Candidatus Halobeggiatoa sp. HSG11]|nr:STAS domain-containing protein [Candidatus Halobeggiatoa sp. HSG11]